MGETAVSTAPGEIICYGLGSCLGVFLHDKFHKAGAAAHIMLPGNSFNCDSDKMLQRIFKGMLDMGCHVPFIGARLVGGASIMNLSTFRIGHRNIMYVKKELQKIGVTIHAEDTGGSRSRTARLDIETGRLSINSSQKSFYTI